MDDRLSFLPHELRDHILSYLPTKDAIKTTILSSRWRNVCSTLSNLVFQQYRFLSENNQSPELKEKHFVEYVNQTFSHHDDSDIYRFDLFLNVVDFRNFIYPLYTLYRWLILASTHNARIMTLSLSRVKKPQRFPVYLFVSNNSLTKLSLSSMTLILPTNTKLEFRNLISFYAERVVFHAVSVTDQLLASCVLETLEMFFCSWKTPFRIFYIASPKLKSLKLVGEYPFCEIHHSSPNLHKFSHHGPRIFFVNPISSLKDARFTIPRGSKATDARGSKIIKGLCNVVDLRLGGLFVEFLVNEGQFLLARLPTSCCSLEKLHLSLYPTKNQFQVMMFLLMRFPRLETLYLYVEQTGHESLNRNKYWETKELHADLKTLKTVVIELFNETEFEYDLVRHFLENSPALERMDIMLMWFHVEVEVNISRLRMEINRYTRASSHVIVSVSMQPVKDTFDIYWYDRSSHSLEIACDRAKYPKFLGEAKEEKCVI